VLHAGGKGRITMNLALRILIDLYLRFQSWAPVPTKNGSEFFPITWAGYFDSQRKGNEVLKREVQYRDNQTDCSSF
jgi:hypothetical protein